MNHNTEYYHKHRDDPKYMEARRLAVREYYYRNKARRKAYIAVSRAVLSGTLTRPRTCSLCLSIDIEAHHNDYSKPLDVTWLCPRHHAELHRVHRFMARHEIDRATLRLIV